MPVSGTQRLLRGTPFHVALVLSLTVLAALAIAGAIAQFLVREELARRLDGTIADTFAVISQSFGDNDLADLEASVASHVDTATHGGLVFRLADAGGHMLIGNIAANVGIRSGWSVISGSELGQPDGHINYRLFTGQIGTNQLVVGASLREIDEIWRLVATSLTWSALTFVLLVLAAGGLLALRAQRRLDEIAATLYLVGQGDLAARINVRGNGDIDRLAASVNVALNRLASLVESMRQVSVDIAHDLKTPLGRLAITVEEAIDAEATGRPLRPLLEQAQAEAGRINVTFEALLRIAQIEAGARRARFANVELAEVIATVAEVYEDLAIERGQKLLVSPVSGLAPVRGDRELLMQLIANLVENALRHSPPDTDVEVSIAADATASTIVIADHGPGIPENERERVFRRLYRMDKSRNTPGSGLGLSLVKAVADLHGATVALEDNRPGLRVVLHIPRREGGG